MPEQGDRGGSLDPSQAPADPRRGWFRGDLDGLRAVAVLLVVAYHAHVAGFGGGFVGVDVFFVISGYLITKKLVAEVDRTDRVDLLGFWGRRIRRLVPALALMLVVVLALALVIQGPLAWESAAVQARAAALYVSNFYFAAQPTGYFGVDLSSSLFLHTWSLGVEEQFYLLWPLLFLGLGLLSRDRGRRRVGLLRVVLAAVLVVSLVVSVLLTRSGSTMAFFGLASRAWEFAVAGLLAVITLPVWLRRPAAQVAMVVAGLGMVLAAAFVLSSTDPYPGYRAILPVAGAILVLAGGEAALGGGSNLVSRLLAVAPAQWLGRVSYSWYLWHWPFIILAVDVFDRDTVKVRVAGAVVSLGVAVVAHYLVENPIRFSSRIVTSRRLTYGGAAILTVVTLATTVLVVGSSRRAIADDPLLAAVQRAPHDRAVDVPCTATGVSSGGLQYCIDGDVGADRTVVLLGDSHAEQWRVAFSDAAKAQGLRLVTIWRSACPSVAAPIVYLHDSKVECQAFEQASLDAVAELDPALVVISNTTNYRVWGAPGAASPAAGIESVWHDAYQSRVEGLRGQGIAVAAIVDNPGSYSVDPLKCLDDTSSASDCRIPRNEALVGPPIRFAEAQVAKQLDVPRFDITDDLCDSTSCGFVVDGDVSALSDESHLTVTYTRRFVGQIEAFLSQALAAGG